LQPCFGMNVLGHSSWRVQARRPFSRPVHKTSQPDRLLGEAGSSRRFGAVIEASDIDDTPVFHSEDLPARSGNAKFVGCRGARHAKPDQKAVGADHHLGHCRRQSLIAGSLVPGQDLAPITTSPLRLIRRPPMHIRSEQILISVKVAGPKCGPYPLGQLCEVRVHGTRLVVDSSSPSCSADVSVARENRRLGLPANRDNGTRLLGRRAVISNPR
jgi:hypothetical protein